jgi:hypothetical protein
MNAQPHLKVGFVSERLDTRYDMATANCWHLATNALATLYGTAMPAFRKRDAATKKARVKAANGFAVWDGWEEIKGAADGALVLMSKDGCEPDLHAGVFIVLPFQSGILHTNDPHGVVFETIGDVTHSRGFNIIRFFRPIP